MEPRHITTICAAFIAIWALSSQTLAQQKTVNACEDEWRANRVENQAKGITETAYVAKCRTAGAGAPPTVLAPAPNTVPPTATPTVTPAPTVRPAPAARTTPAGANQFTTETLAKSRCPTDMIVWVNL